MTHCVAMRLKAGLLFASDTRTNAGVDHIASFWQDVSVPDPAPARDRDPQRRQSGHHAVGAVALRQRLQGEGEHLLNVPSLYDAAVLVGRTLRKWWRARLRCPQPEPGRGLRRQLPARRPDQGRGAAPLPHLPAGQFHRSDRRHAPLPDRREQVRQAHHRPRDQYDTTQLPEAAKCTLVSFDSTIRSNLSVGLPIDILMLRANQFEQAMQPPHRIGREDPYFNRLREGWSEGLRRGV